VLRLLDANPSSGFASATYAIIAPLAGVLGGPAAGGSVIEFNALVAIIVYALIEKYSPSSRETVLLLPL
jgi:hypothetical protein